MGCTGIYGSESGQSTLAGVRHTQLMVHDPSSQINRKISDVCVEVNTVNTHGLEYGGKEKRKTWKH